MPKKRATPEAPVSESTMPAQFRVTLRQITALRGEAQRRAETAAAERRTIPRADVSAVLRALLDDWIDSGAALPERLTKGKR